MPVTALQDLPAAHRAIGLIAAVLLSACQMTAATSNLAPPDLAPPNLASPRPAAALLGGTFVVAGPRGYCVDPASKRELGDTAVVLLGRCKEAGPVIPALLTMSVGPTASAGVLAAGGAALTGFFTSPEGRAALSRSGRARDVTIIAALGAGDAYLLHLNDGAVGEYWRAFVGLNGRLITVSANGAQNAPLSANDGRALVDATLTALRRAN